MRIYANWTEATSEVARDLKELGLIVPTLSIQSQVPPEGFEEVHELVDYSYTVLDPNPNLLNPTQPWAEAEWAERIGGLRGYRGHISNPGKAWELRREVWEPLLNKMGRFDYNYAERLKVTLEEVISALKNNPTSRQLWVPVWWPVDDSRLGKQRVPCSIGYWFRFRAEKLNMTYVMRSADFYLHYQNDCWLAVKLLDWVCGQVSMPMGTFSHFIGSLHVFKPYVKEVF